MGGLTTLVIPSGIAATIMLADQATKQIARNEFSEGEFMSVGPVGIGRLENSQALGNARAAGSTSALIAGLGVAAGATVTAFISKNPWVRGGAAAVAAGALSNTIDRRATGSVTDPLKIGPFVVNIADAAIVGGMLAISVPFVRHMM